MESAQRIQRYYLPEYTFSKPKNADQYSLHITFAHKDGTLIVFPFGSLQPRFLKRTVRLLDTTGITHKLTFSDALKHLALRAKPQADAPT
jgi:hypothetical protein